MRADTIHIAKQISDLTQGDRVLFKNFGYRTVATAEPSLDNILRHATTGQEVVAIEIKFTDGVVMVAHPGWSVRVATASSLAPQCSFKTSVA